MGAIASWIFQPSCGPTLVAGLPAAGSAARRYALRCSRDTKSRPGSSASLEICFLATRVDGNSIR
jgi:hypothetical protein